MSLRLCRKTHSFLQYSALMTVTDAYESYNISNQTSSIKTLLNIFHQKFHTSHIFYLHLNLWYYLLFLPHGRNVNNLVILILLFFNITCHKFHLVVVIALVIIFYLNEQNLLLTNFSLISDSLWNCDPFFFISNICHLVGIDNVYIGFP